MVFFPPVLLVCKKKVRNRERKGEGREGASERERESQKKKMVSALYILEAECLWSASWGEIGGFYSLSPSRGTQTKQKKVYSEFTKWPSNVYKISSPHSNLLTLESDEVFEKAFFNLLAFQSN